MLLSHINLRRYMAGPHEILGIPQTAKKEDIKRAYRRLSMIYHPDKPTGNADKFLKIKTAYEALMVPDTTRIHQQYEHRTKPFVRVTRTYFKDNGNLEIFLDFSNLLHAVTFAMEATYTQEWQLYGLKGGIFEVDKRLLEQSGYAFLIAFTTISGSTLTNTFVFDDPRPWYKILTHKMFKWLR